MSRPLLLLPPAALRARMHAAGDARLANSPARQPTPCQRLAADLRPRRCCTTLRAPRFLPATAACLA